MLPGFKPWPISKASIVGTEDVFPVRRVYCVGRNYLAHAREMGADEREPPFFFTKFADTVVPSGTALTYPRATEDYHYEGELVIAIGASVVNISVDQASKAIFGYACGLDMTRRDLQLVARDKGRPWDMGKNFSEAAVLGPITPAADVPKLAGRMLTLSVNGTIKQETDLSLLIWSCAEIVSELSRYDDLAPGDLIYTGTPAGVGAVMPGDRIDLSIDGLQPIFTTIRQ
ncbi:MAG: fumarylacetoacetate hydrolase family protein [Sphingopyxis sp.]|nr:fumarylacetoacetate hydrolase family protein [Sphingopyxis sp.]